jgi:hypothetical protein
MRVVVLILGVIVMLAGAGCAVGGGAIAVLFGPDGRFESKDGDLQSDTRALVFEADDIGDNEPDEGGWVELSDIKVRVSAEATSADEEIFVGIGRAEDVDPYVAGFSHDVVTDVEFDPFELERVPSGGTGTPDDPAEQDFWLESASGAGRQVVEHGLESGDFRVVVMNADGSPGVDAEGSVGVEVPHIFWVGIGLLIAGALVAIGGLVLIVMMAMRIGRGSEPRPAAPAAPPPAGPAS